MDCLQLQCVFCQKTPRWERGPHLDMKNEGFLWLCFFKWLKYSPCKIRNSRSSKRVNFTSNFFQWLRNSNTISFWLPKSTGYRSCCLRCLHVDIWKKVKLRTQWFHKRVMINFLLIFCKFAFDLALTAIRAFFSIWNLQKFCSWYPKAIYKEDLNQYLCFHRYRKLRHKLLGLCNWTAEGWHKLPQHLRSD